jgi:quercetin 2,3-dioxygenase
MIKKSILPAGKRGHVDYGWLDTYHTFSFGSYHNPYSMNFGALRVLNDDVLRGESGFGAHGHKNMEIVSVPLQGALAHGDSTGHTSVIRLNDVQVMSAGTGIIHTERNHSAHEPVSFLQLWILPATQNLPPRYAQQSFDPKTWKNKFVFLVGSRQQQQGKLWINQQAVIARASLEPGKRVSYALQTPGHGVYVFVIEGKASVVGVVLSKRDGMGVEGVNELVCQGLETCDVLLIEVPMQSA